MVKKLQRDSYALVKELENKNTELERENRKLLSKVLHVYHVGHLPLGVVPVKNMHVGYFVLKIYNILLSA